MNSVPRDVTLPSLDTQVTRRPHWRHCSRLTFTLPPSCWNKWGLQSSSASSSLLATGPFTTKPLQKSGRSEDHALLEASPSAYQELGHGQPLPPSMRIRPGQYRWHWINFAASICPQATSQLTCSICFTYRRLQYERILRRLPFWLFTVMCPGLFVFSCFLMSVLTLVLRNWFKQRYASCGPPRAVARLGRMIALHHRMSQNAGDMMQLIQETLNQADESHSRRHRDGHGWKCGGQPQIAVLLHHHGGHQRPYRSAFDEPRGARLRWSAGLQKGRSIMDKGEANRRRTKRKRGRTTSSEQTDLPEPPARPAPRTPRFLPILAWYPLLNLFLNLRLTLILELPRKHLVPGQRR